MGYRFKRESGYPATLDPERFVNVPFVVSLVEVRTVDLDGDPQRVAELEVMEASAVGGAGAHVSLWESVSLAPVFNAQPGAIFRLTYQGKVDHPKDPKKTVKRWFVETGEDDGEF